MPTRRKTKMVKRTKPKLSATNEELDMSKAEQEAKLDNFLKDFDMEVQSRVAAMRSQAKQMCSIIQQAFNLEILRLPTDIRDMKYTLLFGEEEKKQVCKDLTNSVDQLVSQLISSSSESKEPDTATTQKRKGKPRKTATAKKGTTKRAGRKAKEQDENEAPTTVKRPTRASSRKKPMDMVTPADKLGSASVWDTPFMTPKFDPRLPVTPAMTRKAKIGEVLMSMSGSPVVATPMHENIVSNQPTSTLQVFEEDLENLNLDEESRQSVMLALQKSLQRIITHTSQGSNAI